MQKRIVFGGLVQALEVFAYVLFLVASISHLAPRLEAVFMAHDHLEILAPIIILSLLTFSVAAVGTIIFGRPALLAFSQELKLAAQLIVSTIAWGLILLIATVSLVYLINKDKVNSYHNYNRPVVHSVSSPPPGTPLPQDFIDI